MFLKLKKSSNTILLILLLSVNADATQLIANADKSHQQANISAHEQNRLAVEGRRIASVVPSQKGVISVIKDEALGALYFTLASTTHHGSITLFISDDQGATYKLILQPRSIPGAEIILQPSALSRGYRSAHSAGPAGSYLSTIKDLIANMAEVDDHYAADIVTINKEVKLWKESRLILLNKYVGVDGLVGEKYHLSNISPSPMQLVEQEFYRSGVLAVAIEQHALAAGESTNVLIVREGGRHEQ